MKYNYQQTACVLAGLRLLQEKLHDEGRDSVLQMDHFIDIEPLGSEGIDSLCEEINCVGNDERFFVVSYNLSLGDYDFPDKLLMRCPGPSDIQKEVIKRLLKLRGGGKIDKYNSNSIVFDKESDFAISISRASFEEISAENHELLRHHISAGD
tara:strand:- start:210 stop:668 length:459 start_codon:yes stop_codon:yes gene_type:complete